MSVARIAPGVSDNPASQDAVVKGVMNVTMNPKVSFWQELTQVTDERGIKCFTDVPRVDRQWVRTVVTDDHSLAGVWFVQLLRKPGAR